MFEKRDGGRKRNKGSMGRRIKRVVNTMKQRNLCKQYLIIVDEYWNTYMAVMPASQLVLFI